MLINSFGAWTFGAIAIGLLSTLGWTQADAVFGRSNGGAIALSTPSGADLSDAEASIDAPFVAQNPAFPDVPVDYWARPFIQGLAQDGILAGDQEGRFRPDAPITRAEFAALIGSAFSPSAAQPAQNFPDVPSSHWAFEAVRAANRAGFLSGYLDGRFWPSRNITRSEVLVSLASGLGAVSPDAPAQTIALYEDSRLIPAWAVDKIAAATERRLVVNHPQIQTLNPNRVATRAEVAAMVYQALVVPDGMPPVLSPYTVNGDVLAQVRRIQEIGASPDLAAASALAGHDVDAAQAVPALVNLLKSISRLKDSEPHVTVHEPEDLFEFDLEEPVRLLPNDGPSTPLPMTERSDRLIVNPIRLPFDVFIGRPFLFDPDASNTESPEDSARVLVEEEADIPALMYLSPERWTVFESTLTALSQMETSVPALTALLNEEDPLLREAGIYGIGQIGPGAEAAGPSLKSLLQTDNTPPVRLNAVRALEAISAPPSASTLAVLVDVFTDELEKVSVRSAAAETLGRSSLDNIRVREVSQLVRNYERSDNDNALTVTVCAYTNEMLSSSEAIAALGPLLNRGSLEMRLRVVQILSAIATPEADALLSEALGNGAETVRLAAAGALLLRGEAAAVVMPELERLRQSTDPGIVAEASRLLDVAQGNAPPEPPNELDVGGVVFIDDFLVVDFLGQYSRRAYRSETEYDDHVVLSLQCAPPLYALAGVFDLYYSFISRWPW